MNSGGVRLFYSDIKRGMGKPHTMSPERSGARLV
jgi:hypothetical protein